MIKKIYYRVATMKLWTRYDPFSIVSLGILILLIAGVFVGV